MLSWLRRNNPKRVPALFWIAATVGVVAPLWTAEGLSIVLSPSPFHYIEVRQYAIHLDGAPLGLYLACAMTAIASTLLVLLTMLAAPSRMSKLLLLFVASFGLLINRPLYGMMAVLIEQYR